MKKRVLFFGLSALALSMTTGGSILSTSVVAQEKTYRVAVIRWEPNDIYFNGVQYGHELERARIEARDGVKIEFSVFGANDVSAQRNALDAQVSRGVDGVLLNPWRGEAMSSTVAELSAQNIPVVASSAFVPRAKSSFVAFDNEMAGRKGAEAIINWLDTNRGEEWRAKGGIFIELRCIITASFDIERSRGYRSVFDPLAAENSNIKVETQVADCEGSTARKVIDDFISRYGGDKILGVASIDGTMGVGGVVPAFAAQGLLKKSNDPAHIPVATIDGTEPELIALERGDITHISVQPAIAEGVMAMRVLYDMMKSGKLLDRLEEPGIYPIEEEELWAPVEIIPSDDFDGNWFKTQTYSIPGDTSPTDPRVWPNLMKAAE